MRTILILLSHAYMEYVTWPHQVWSERLGGYERPSFYCRTVDFSSVVWC
jgi:hypothetical protein